MSSKARSIRRSHRLRRRYRCSLVGACVFRNQEGATRSEKVVRCGEYTRKSSEKGLEQSFNSLHAQRDHCGSAVSSGWGKLHADSCSKEGTTIRLLHSSCTLSYPPSAGSRHRGGCTEAATQVSNRPWLHQQAVSAPRSSKAALGDGSSTTSSGALEGRIWTKFCSPSKARYEGGDLRREFVGRDQQGESLGRVAGWLEDGYDSPGSHHSERGLDDQTPRERTQVAAAW